MLPSCIRAALILFVTTALVSATEAAQQTAAATNVSFNATLQAPCATPAPAPAPCAAPAPACTPVPTCTTCAPVPCCPKPCITYRHRHVHHKVCCGCCQPEPLKYVLMTKNPCSGCPVEIPLCIPGCTKGEPTVCCDSGIFGRDVIWYEWCNGFKVKVAFTRGGDVIVTTYGS
jgi:hypothetical protein